MLVIIRVLAQITDGLCVTRRQLFERLDMIPTLLVVGRSNEMNIHDGMIGLSIDGH